MAMPIPIRFLVANDYSEMALQLTDTLDLNTRSAVSRELDAEEYNFGHVKRISQAC